MGHLCAHAHDERDRVKPKGGGEGADRTAKSPTLTASANATQFVPRDAGMANALVPSKSQALIATSVPPTPSTGSVIFVEWQATRPLLVNTPRTLAGALLKPRKADDLSGIAL